MTTLTKGISICLVTQRGPAGGRRPSTIADQDLKIVNDADHHDCALFNFRFILSLFFVAPKYFESLKSYGIKKCDLPCLDGYFSRITLGSVWETVDMRTDTVGVPGCATSHSPAREALSRSLLGTAKRSSALWGGGSDSARISRLFGLAIENTRLHQAARDVVAAARDQRRTRVVFVNAHVINCAMSNPAYRADISSADRIFADGSGMALAARMCGTPLIDNVNGTDLFPLLCQEAIKSGTPIFLLGGKPGVAEKAAQTITDFGWGAAIAGTHDGYFAPGSADEDRVIGAINASRAQIVLVGMGVPVQESWCAANASRLDAPVIAGVGGLFDFFSGAIPRAPKLMRTAGCEWLWRLAMEPKRMARRYLVGNAVFLARAAREAMNLRQRTGRTVSAATAEQRSS